MEIDLEVDARHLQCPLPILRAKKALAQIASGQVLRVVTTDAASVRDFAAFAAQTGHTLLKQETLAGGEFVHILRRR